MADINQQKQDTYARVLADSRGDEDEKLGRFGAAEDQEKVTGKFPSSTELKAAENELIIKDSAAEASGVRTSNYNTQGGAIADKILAEKEQKKEDQRNRDFIALQTRYDNAQAALKERMQACKDVRKLIENGEFDRNNPEHMDRLRAMLGKDATEEDVQAFLDLPPEEQIEQIDAIHQGTAEAIERNRNKECTEENVSAMEADSRKAFKANQETEDLGADSRHVQTVNDVEQYREENEVPEDEIVGNFSRALGKIEQDYPDASQHLERLQAQKELMEGLDDNEMCAVACCGSYDEMFGDDYFSELENALTTGAQNNDAAPTSSPIPN